MASLTDLINRIKEYESCTSYKLTKRLPLIIKLNLKSFTKLSRNLVKPYCPDLMKIMVDTMCQLCREIDGAVIAYHHYDEIIIITRNNQNLETDPWLGNDLQKLVSTSSSIATYEFLELFYNYEKDLNLGTRPLFESKVFTVPSYNEAVNLLIDRQQKCLNYAIGSAALTELTNKLGFERANRSVRSANLGQRLDLLIDECDIDFDKYYHSSFRLGVLCYQSSIVDSSKIKWAFDTNPPIFPDLSSQEFLKEIISK